MNKMKKEKINVNPDWNKKMQNDTISEILKINN